MTRGNVEYNLNVSPFWCVIDNVKFFFSSALHKRKFIERFSENRDKIRVSLENRFNIHFDINILADLMLYKTLENRGFLIEIEGEKVECLNNIILSGGKLTAKKQEKQ